MCVSCHDFEYKLIANSSFVFKNPPSACMINFYSMGYVIDNAARGTVA